MQRVTGIGGIFFKCDDPEQVKDWYRDNLGFEPDAHGYVSFEWRHPDAPEKIGRTAWSPFARTTKYFEPSQKPFMLNYRVRDLDAMLAQLRERGCEVDDRIEDSEFGRFGWVMDPEGNRVELWEPPKQE